MILFFKCMIACEHSEICGRIYSDNRKYDKKIYCIYVVLTMRSYITPGETLKISIYQNLTFKTV